MMNSYLIESLAPLVFRSGKPFGSQASAQDVVFPLPSAGAGLVRALSIEQQKLTFDEHELKPLKKEGWQKVIDHESYQNVLSIRSRGVFLMRLRHDGTTQLLVPKPTNALYLEKKAQESTTTESAKIELVRLSPQPFAEGCGSDLPKGLLPVQMEEAVKGKPKSGATFWTLEHLIQWQENEPLNYEDVNQQGLTTIPIELRTHVAIDDETNSSEDGKLFQTASFDLGYQAKSEDGHQLAHGWENHRYAFMVQTEQDLQEDLATFGGERRLSYFKRLNTTNPLARDTATLLSQINKKKGFCLTLLTPAIFAQGYLPQWIDEQTFTGTLPNSKVKVKLVATAIDRWQAVSGWDSILWQPKATRKAVSAGAVYWFECLTDMDENTLDYLTNTALSDYEQDSRDGFGVALITAWQATK